MAQIGRILMVEDDPNDVELTLTALEEYKLANEVVVTRDSEEALDYLYCRGNYQAMVETEGIICHVRRVETQADFVASLEQGGFDLILADYTLPSFDGLSALKITRKNVWMYHSSLFLEH
jgi:CheY-like chemotaxis protein